MPIRESYYTEVDYPDLCNDPQQRTSYTTAWQRATRWRSNYDSSETLADIAGHCGLASGLAARDALVYYQAYYHGLPVEEYQRTLARYAERELGWPSGRLQDLSDADVDYIAPCEALDEDLPCHEQGCGCNECNPCNCGNAHCERCHPDGPPDWCDCRSCNPPEMDDQGEADEWEGIPDMPVSPPDRCRFGIEIEFNNGDRRSIANALLRNAGIACTTTDYTHEVVRYWKMTTDSTVSGGELVSPILSGDDASIELTREAIRQVKLNGGSTGRNVGMHVHLDVTTFERPQLKVLVKNLRRAERMFASFVPEHRYNRSQGHGGALMHDSEWDAIDNWVDTIDLEDRARGGNRSGHCPVGRAVSFNFNAMLPYGTVECRLLGHTLNTIKVRTWVRTLQAVIVASRMKKKIPAGDVLNWLVRQELLEQEHADHFRSVSISRGNEAMLLAA